MHLVVELVCKISVLKPRSLKILIREIFQKVILTLKGAYTAGKEIIDRVLAEIRKEIENCSNFQVLDFL